MFSTTIAQLIFLLLIYFENLLLFYSRFPVCCEAMESRFSKHVDFWNRYEKIFYDIEMPQVFPDSFIILTRYDIPVTIFRFVWK